MATLSYEAYLASKKKKPTSLLYSSTAAAPNFSGTYKAAPVASPVQKAATPTTAAKPALSYDSYLAQKKPAVAAKPSLLASNKPVDLNANKVQLSPFNPAKPVQKYVAPPELIKKAVYPTVAPQSSLKADPIFNIKPTLRTSLTKGAVATVAKEMLQGVARSYAAFSANVLSPDKKVTPKGALDRAIFGTDKPFGLGEQQPFLDPKNKFAPVLAAAFTLSDAIPGSRALRTAITTKGIQSVMHADDISDLTKMVAKAKAAKTISEDNMVIMRAMFESIGVRLPQGKMQAVDFIDTALKQGQKMARETAVVAADVARTNAKIAEKTMFAEMDAAKGAYAAQGKYQAPTYLAPKPKQSFIEMLRNKVGQYSEAKYQEVKKLVSEEGQRGMIKNPFAASGKEGGLRRTTSMSGPFGGDILSREALKHNNGSDFAKAFTKKYGHDVRIARLSDIEIIEPKLYDEPLAKYRKAFAEGKGDEFIPIVGDGTKTLYRAVDGNHRLQVLKENGVEYVPVRLDNKGGGASTRNLQTPEEFAINNFADHYNRPKSSPIPKELEPLAEQAKISKTYNEFFDWGQTHQGALEKMGFKRTSGGWLQHPETNLRAFYEQVTKGAKATESVPKPILPTAARQGGSYASTPSVRALGDLGSPPSPKTAPYSPQSFPEGSIERGFVTSVKEAEGINPTIKAMAEGQYVPRSSQELMQNAENLVRDFPDIASKLARSTRDDDVTRAVSMQLIRKFSEAGDNEKAIDLIERLAPRATEAGRATQILAYFDKLTPEGVGRFAQRQVDLANEMFPKANLSLTPAQYAKFYDAARDLQKLPEGYERQLATAKLLKSIHDIFPSSIASKLATFQTMAQLLNPKTLIRNLVGNTLFGGLENVRATIATPVDKFLSLFTGQRTVGLPSPTIQVKSFAKGLGQGLEEAKAGVTVGPLSQFDLPRVQVFKDKILGSLEKTLSMALRAPDKAAYTAAFDDSVRMQLKVKGLKAATPEVLEVAHYDGLYRTFQDDNVISRFFSGMKDLLNNVGIKGGEGNKFGLGDLILKYPKTPGALIARGIDYSPAGFVNTVFQAAKPLFGKPFDQKTFVDSFSRALIGSAGLVGTGAVMAKLGIITGSPAEDKDARAIQKQTGQGSYQINVSALKRFVMTGLNKDAAKKREGDWLMTYDWAQPIAAPISLGVKLAEGKAEGTIAALGESITGGVDTLQEQPLVTGLKRLFGYGDIKQGFLSTVEGAAASFIPTIARQANQALDNTARETYDPSMVQRGINLVKAKIPGFAQTLPASIDISGNKRQVYQEGSNSIFNVFLNPAFVTQIKQNPDAKMVLDIFEASGNTAQIPRVVAKKQKVNGEDVELTTQQYIELQQTVGQATREVFLQLAETPEFMSLSDEEKVKRLSTALTDIAKMAKVQVLGDSGDFKTIDEIKGKLTMQSTYARIQELGLKGDQEGIDQLLNGMSDDEYEVYKKVRTQERSKNTTTLRGYLERHDTKAVSFLRGLSPKEKERLLDNMTEDEYSIYQELKRDF